MTSARYILLILLILNSNYHNLEAGTAAPTRRSKSRQEKVKKQLEKRAQTEALEVQTGDQTIDEEERGRFANTELSIAGTDKVVNKAPVTDDAPEPARRTQAGAESSENVNITGEAANPELGEGEIL